MTMTPDHNQINEYVQKWGGSASIVLLDPTCSIFHTPDIEGVMGYRLFKDCAVVFGDPLCKKEEVPLLATEFHNHCQKQGWHVSYVTASEPFAKWTVGNVCHALLEVGQELSVDPCSYKHSGPESRSLRNKLNISIRAGVQVKELQSDEEELEKKIKAVGEAWLNGRKGPQIYLTDVDLFAERNGRRWFYALEGEKMVGMLMLQRIEAKQGWLVHFVMSIPEAPKGTSENLIVSTLQVLHDENCHFLTFGVAQNAAIGEIIGLGKFSQWLTRFVFRASDKMFHLDRRRKFWCKFQPQTEKTYMLFSQPKISIGDVRSIMRAMHVSLT